MTPQFEWSGIRLTVQCHFKSNQWPQIWNEACKLVHHLAEGNMMLQKWSFELQKNEVLMSDQDPLLLGWQTLQAAMGLPDYPAKVNYVTHTDGYLSVIVYSSCPYDQYSKLGLDFVVEWMNLSLFASQRGYSCLNSDLIQQISVYLDKLAISELPLPVRFLHYQLWQKGIAWEWLGKDRTRIGMGNKQSTVQGVPSDLTLNEPEDWRIPIYTVTGSIGKTTTAKLLWQLLQSNHKNLALTASDGAWIGQKCLATGDCIGGITALGLLKSPAVEGAVFEQGRGGILKQGVPYAQSDVGILLNVQDVHLGLDGIETLEQMALTKVTGLRSARLWVLNWDDEHCRRLGEMHAPERTIWFSLSGDQYTLQNLSKKNLAALGVLREAENKPICLSIFQKGNVYRQLGLNDVAPYHGMLGEKTLEELMAAVAAASFGPLTVDDIEHWLPCLSLNNSNHAFRTSIHRQGNVIFVLDKAAERASLKDLKKIMLSLSEREGCIKSMVVLTRSAGEPPERHRESAEVLHSFMDEFVIFDREDTYKTAHALPCYQAGSIPLLLKSFFEQNNDEQGVNKPVTVTENWIAARKLVCEKLSDAEGKTLVLINQPGTGLTELNEQILNFVNNRLEN